MPQPSEDVGDKVSTFYQLDRIGKHPTSHFAPRQELEDIERDLCQLTVGSPEARIVSLVGLGGSGKMQLMLQIRMVRRDKYGVVLWFDAESLSTLDESFLLAASQLGLVLPLITTPVSRPENKIVRYLSRLGLMLRLLKRSYVGVSNSGSVPWS